MGRFEREKISKKVNTASHIFAALAGVGIILIVLQLFSKTTGFDLFNINYTLSKLFSDEATQKKKAVQPESELTTAFFNNAIKPLNENNEALTKAASFLQNNITVTPIKPSGTSVAGDKQEKPLQKYSLIDITSLITFRDFFQPVVESFYSGYLNQNGILPLVKEVKYSKWSLGISVTPGISFTHIKYTNVSEIYTRRVGNTQYGFYQTQKERNQMNKSLMKYSLGLDITYRVNSKLGIQSGIVYLNTGESVLVKEKTVEIDPPGSISPGDNKYFEGEPDFGSPDDNGSENNVRFANNLSYFEVPLILNYKLKTLNKLTNIEMQAGMSLTRLDYVSAMVYNFDNDGYYLITGSQPSIYRKYGSNAIFGLSFNKYITNSIQLFANPQFKLGLTNIFDSGYNMKQHYYSAGVRLGMRINL